ncbi:MAG: hypothetical protein IJ480_05540 [Clostridia bacterium]|nr:hypothetical protein [Clostridia bacterium]
MTQIFKTAESFPAGARVVCIGDSITAGVNYCTRAAAFYKKYLPERKVVFHGAGISGGSLTSALMYYDTQVTPFAPTHATVMLGVNDSDRSALTLTDPEARKSRLDAAFEKYCRLMDELLDRLAADGVKVTLCTPAPYAEFFVTDETPLPGGYALILRYAEQVRRTAGERGLGLIDFHSFLSERYLTEEIYRPDHVHPNELGQYRLAECFLGSQGLEIDPYQPIEELKAAEPLLGEWNDLAGKVAGLYAVEWMVIRNFALPTEEKLALVQSYIDDGRYSEQLYFRNITGMFMENKPHEAEILNRMREIREELYR